MDLNKKGKVFFLIGILSALFSYSIITLNYFPYFGMAVSLILFALFSYVLKKDKNKDTNWYLVLTLLFSTLLVVRSEGVITFLNFTASIFFGTLMLMSAKKDLRGFLLTFLSPFIFVMTSLLTKSKYYPELEKNKKPSKTGVINITIGILLSGIMLAIILPLLATANPIFEKLVSNMWRLLNIEYLFTVIGSENLFIWSLRLMFFLVFLFILPKMLTLMNENIGFELPKVLNISSLPLEIPKIILGIVLLVFFMTELQFYFADSQTLQDLGFSNSEHTREIFGQLTVVAGFLFLLIFNDKASNPHSKIMTFVLGFQGIFLTLIAFRSVFEYINSWGFTYKRLYGISFATLILSVLILFLYSFKNKDLGGVFVKRSIMIYAIILFLVNLINFDYLIYHYRKASTGQGIDHVYLTQLSADSLSYKDQLEELENIYVNPEAKVLFARSNAPFRFTVKLDSLKNKYEKFDIRIFNLLDFLQYQEIKDVDTDYHMNRFNTYKYPHNY